MSKEKQAYITEFITKTRKSRATVVPDNDDPNYEVTVGGESWMKGKGREYEQRIKRKCEALISKLQSEHLKNFN